MYKFNIKINKGDFFFHNLKHLRPLRAGQTCNRELLVPLLVLFTSLSQLLMVCKTKKDIEKEGTLTKEQSVGFKTLNCFWKYVTTFAKISVLFKYPFILFLLWLIFSATEGIGTEKKGFNRKGDMSKEVFLFTKINMKMVNGLDPSQFREPFKNLKGLS